MEFGPGRSLATAIDEALAGGADALAVAGGDGSLATVAAAALAHDLPFVCVPAGTRNHFARDLGLDPADPIAALDALSDGIEGRIDVGEVSGHLFLNNVSLGIYAEAVRRRGVSRCEGAHLGRDRARRPRPGHRDLRTGHRRRPRRQPYRSCDRARVEQSLRPGRAVLARRPPDAERRPARDHRHRPTGAWTQAPRSRVELRLVAGRCLQQRACRDRRRSGGAVTAARVRDPAGGAAGQNASPGPFRRRQRSSAATANGAKATPLTDPAIASSG